MKAAILVEQKKPLVVADIDLPQTLNYGQVLVKVHYSGICGAQLNEIDGAKGPDKFLPHLLGHEGGGVVAKIGDGVTVVSPGDHVVMHWMKGDGIHSATPKYNWGGKTVNAGWVTTFNEYAVVSENRVTRIPKKFDLKLAALFGCAVTTAFGVLKNDAKVKCGESLVIYGAGGVGSSVIRAAKTAGLYPVIAVDVNSYKLRTAKKLGADVAVNGKTGNVKQLLKKLTGSEYADVVIDTTGINAIREAAYELTSPLGRTILVGVPQHKDDRMKIDSYPLHFDKVITGSHGGDTYPSYDIPRLVRMVQSGQLKVDDLITHEYTLDKINDAIKKTRSGEAIRCVIRMI